MAIPLYTTGSLSPTFVSAPPVGVAVKLPSAFALFERFPTVLREPLSASDTLSEAQKTCAEMRGKNEFFGYSDSRNQFFGNWDFSPDCDQGRILLYEALLAVFSCGRACMPRTFCFCKAGNAIRIAGRSGMHVLVEHSGALRTGRACQKRLVSRKSKQTEIEQTFFNSYTF